MRRKSRQKNKGEPKKWSGVFYRRNIIVFLSTFALEGWLNGHSLRVGSQSSTSLSRVAWSILECARRTSTFLSCAFREQEDDQAALPILLRARVPGAQDQCGCPSILFSSLRGIRRDEYEDFETLCGVILHAMFFPGRRHRPLPRTEHFFL
jgi:hypothetical protein